MTTTLSIEDQINEVLGKHNEKAISDVAVATGWSISALRSKVGEEIEHNLCHRPYCYAIKERKEVLEYIKLVTDLKMKRLIIKLNS